MSLDLEDMSAWIGFYSGFLASASGERIVFVFHLLSFLGTRWDKAVAWRSSFRSAAWGATIAAHVKNLGPAL